VAGELPPQIVEFLGALGVVADLGPMQLLARPLNDLYRSGFTHEIAMVDQLTYKINIKWKKRRSLSADFDTFECRQECSVLEYLILFNSWFLMREP
jgi:hypothetical protein